MWINRKPIERLREDRSALVMETKWHHYIRCYKWSNYTNVLKRKYLFEILYDWYHPKINNPIDMVLSHNDSINRVMVRAWLGPYGTNDPYNQRAMVGQGHDEFFRALLRINAKVCMISQSRLRWTNLKQLWNKILD